MKNIAYNSAMCVSINIIKPPDFIWWVCRSEHPVRRDKVKAK
jgi:hypothetical protein